MLDRYLESNLRHKLDLLSYLYLNGGNVSIRGLQQALHLSSSGLTTLLDELTYDICEIGKVERQSSHVRLSIREGNHFLQLFHAVCRSCIVLRCLRFLILNDEKQPFSNFADQEYLTHSSAYRIRKSCLNYLHDIGLKVKNNLVVGPEYRIRYLIALLQYRYGIECYPVDADTKQIFRQFILSTNDSIDMDFLERTESEYGFSECLFILAWKRRKYPLSGMESDQIRQLQQLFVYDALRTAICQELEPALGLTFSKIEQDYFYLVFITTNTCLFADHWLETDIQVIQDIIFKDPLFSDLVFRFGQRYGMELTASRAVQSTLIYFYKKCILELQCIIPDQNVALVIPRNSTDLILLEQLTQLFNEWQQANGIQYRIDSDHLLTISLQLEFIMRQLTPSVPIIVVSDVNATLEALRLFLFRSFSHQRVSITLLLVNAISLEKVCAQRDSVIILQKRFEMLAHASGLYEHNTVIPITAEMDERSIHDIHLAVVAHERKNFLKMIGADGATNRLL